ncbi:MAG TPA: hypothetical protein PLG47_03570 [Candidatus Dojkabacteria bacterium]|nr:hypothetical protein [Candidatus Dojkabacteria bacterium]
MSEEKIRKKIVVKSRNDLVFGLLYSDFMKFFFELDPEEEKESDDFTKKIKSTLKRNMKALNIVNQATTKIKKELEIPKKEDRVKFDWTFYDNGGEIIFDLTGSESEIKEWTRQSKLSKTVMNKYNYFEIEVLDV